MPELTVGERYVVLLEAEQEPARSRARSSASTRVSTASSATSRASAVVRDRSGRPLAADAVPAGARGARGDPTLDAFLDTLRAARPR